MEYGIEHYNECSPNFCEPLYFVLSRKLRHFSIEFLQQGGVKPHVVFHFSIDQPQIHSVGTRQFTYYGCRISQEYMGYGYDGTGGRFTIKLLEYYSSSLSAHAAFQFHVRNENISLRELIQILCGTHPTYRSSGHRRDLTDFNFVPVPGGGSMDGCRDWITQSFIRFHRYGIVGWDATGLAHGLPGMTAADRANQVDVAGHHVTVIMINFRTLVPNNGFHNVIPHNYLINSGPDEQRRWYCTITPMYMNRGVFLSGFQRHERYNHHNLPYVQQPSAGGPGIPPGGDSGDDSNQGGDGGNYGFGSYWDGVYH